jgi:hypothetical protein
MSPPLGRHQGPNPSRRCRRAAFPRASPPPPPEDAAERSSRRRRRRRGLSRPRRLVVWGNNLGGGGGPRWRGGERRCREGAWWSCGGRMVEATAPYCSRSHMAAGPDLGLGGPMRAAVAARGAPTPAGSSSRGGRPTWGLLP